jgi:hypothetical protein
MRLGDVDDFFGDEWLRPEEMGERPELDPFGDDAPIECLVDGYEICESCG